MSSEPGDPIPSFISSMKGIVAIGIIGSLLQFLLIGVVIYYCIQCIRKAKLDDFLGRFNTTAEPSMNSPHNWKDDDETMERFLNDMAREKPIRFTSQELNRYTKNYSKRLGSGGFGVVYKGKFPNGIKFAVKVLNQSSDKRVEEQFMAEVGTIGKTYHVNLVRLYGFCIDLHTSALVYEYMENGSLDKFLFRIETPKIEWEKLQEIAIGTAKGLAYLHEECRQRIIHYDIKPGNVLLDVNFSPKVADFGLATLCNRDNTHISLSRYRGTPGYSAPECMLHTYPISHKCDVYSFGILLFEIIRRRKNVDVNQVDSIDWFPKKAWEEFEKGRLENLIMEIGIEEKEKAERMFMVALWCVQNSPDSRPSMSTVVKMLEGEVGISSPPNPFSYLYSAGIELPANRDGHASSSNTPTAESDSTPIMKKYEIELATL